MSIPPSVERLAIGNKPLKSANNVGSASSSAADKRHVDAEVGIGGVVLDFGRPGGAGLGRGSRGWEWTWAKRENPRLILQHGTPELLVPPTRSLDPEMGSQTSMSTITKSANQVIRAAVDKYEHLGLDELILPNLEEIHAELKNPFVDHARGNVLEVIQNPRAKYVKTMLAFAVGEVGQDLNISPFLPKSFASKSNLNLTDFSPSGEPVQTFQTSILQICGSPAQHARRKHWEATCLLVRLHSAVHWLHVLPNQTFTMLGDDQCASTVSIGSIRTADTEDRRIVDMALDPNSWGRAVLVDEGGGVWLWVEESMEIRERLEKVLRLTKIREPVETPKAGFWRVAFGPKDDTVVVVGEREAVLLDLQDLSHPPIILLTLSGEARFFTSLDNTMAARKSTFFVFCTTHEVIWVDELHPGVPALVWKHHYGGGQLRDLQVSTILESGTYRILLSSASHALVMVYTVSDGTPLESICRPYLLPLPTPLMGVQSMASLGLLRNSRPSSTLWIVMGHDGSIHGAPLFSPRDLTSAGKEDRANRPARIESSWNQTAAAMPRETRQIRMAVNAIGGDEEADPSAMQSKLMNARWAWLEINETPPAGEGKLYADELERYLREYEAPLAHWITGAELAREANASVESEHEPKYAPVNADTTDSALWEDIRLDKHLHKIAAFPNGTEGDSLSAVLQRLSSAFPPPPNLPPNLRQRHRDDLFRLALDLAWSGIVLSTDPLPSPIPLAKPQDVYGADEFLSRAANLTLNEREPPPLAFTVLPPRAPVSPFDSAPPSPTMSDGEPGTQVHANADDALSSIPARALISEWILSSPPGEYMWRPWRGPSDPSSTVALDRSIRLIKPLPSPRHGQMPTFASQQFPGAPRVYSSTQPPALSSGRGPPLLGGNASLGDIMRGFERARSGSPGPAPGEEAGDEGMPMTQVERGPFGGRAPEKKKKGKKRAGGF